MGITVKVNGKPEEIQETDLRSFLISKGINPNVVACELNLSIVKRQALAETRLCAGDELEIIQMIGGG